MSDSILLSKFWDTEETILQRMWWRPKVRLLSKYLRFFTPSFNAYWMYCKWQPEIKYGHPRVLALNARSDLSDDGILNTNGDAKMLAAEVDNSLYDMIDMIDWDLSGLLPLRVESVEAECLLQARYNVSIYVYQGDFCLLVFLCVWSCYRWGDRKWYNIFLIFLQ